MTRRSTNEIVCYQCFEKCRIVEESQGWKKNSRPVVVNVDGTRHDCNGGQDNEKRKGD